ncbi:MAG: hypothetical protein WBA48_18735, partial [Xanthobacteraceae bacterium]
AFRTGSRAAAARQAERDAAKSGGAGQPARPSFLENRPSPAPEEPRGDERPAWASRPEPHNEAAAPYDTPPSAARERTGSPRRSLEPDRAPQGVADPAAHGGGSGGGQGVRGFRDVVADADDLGRATAKANRAARRTYANVPSPSPEFDRLEPSMEDRGVGAPGSSDYDEGIAEASEPPPSRPQRRGGKGRRVKTGGGFPFKGAIILGLVLILAGAGILWGQKGLTYVRGLLGKQAAVTTQAPKNTSTAPPPKITDRVGQPGSTDAVAPVAQRVVLYDEDPSDPKGKQYVGSVVWRTEPVKSNDGKPDDIAVRADIDIPERKFKMTMSFRRNTDTSLPASHTAELTFVLPPDFDNGTVANVPGILMKSNEQARGTPLAGLAVKVTDGFFLIGLSNVESDRARNLQLLKERSWFDVPLVYSNQRRAIIAIEKGAPGERAFNGAFMAWGE